jgi:hypothetical protein
MVLIPPVLALNKLDRFPQNLAQNWRQRKNLEPVRTLINDPVDHFSEAVRLQRWLQVLYKKSL